MFLLSAWVKRSRSCTQFTAGVCMWGAGYRKGELKTYSVKGWYKNSDYEQQGWLQSDCSVWRISGRNHTKLTLTESKESLEELLTTCKMIFFRDLFVLTFKLCVCVYTRVTAVPTLRGQERSLDNPEVEIQVVVSHVVWVLYIICLTTLHYSALRGNSQYWRLPALLGLSFIAHSAK